MAAVREAADGKPATVLVAGDAGSGKSRLIGELAVQVRAVGVRVGIGGCVDFGAVGVPYAPLMELLRDLAAQMAPAWDERAGDLPGELGRLIAASPAAGERGPEGVFGSTPGRFLELLLGLLVQLAESAPLLMVIEDLHWADPSTRAMMAFLARNLRRCRVAVIGTYRRDALKRRDPLRPLLAELTRAGADRVDLGGFNRLELRTMLAGISEAPPTSSLVDEILCRSDGNPFYARSYSPPSRPVRPACPSRCERSS